MVKESTLRTEGQLADDFKHDALNVDAVRYILKKAKLAPKATIPYGKGEARFYDRDEAYEVIRKELAERAARMTPKKADTAPPQADAKDVKYLIGLVEEQQETIKQLVAGNQMLFKHIEGIAHQVALLVKEWQPKEAA